MSAQGFSRVGSSGALRRGRKEGWKGGREKGEDRTRYAYMRACLCENRNGFNGAVGRISPIACVYIDQSRLSSYYSDRLAPGR